MNTLINLFGPSAAGKSTIADLLQDRIDDLRTIDFDVIKRQIPDYDWRKHAQIGRDMTLDELARAHWKTPVLLLMPSPKDEAEYSRTSTLATSHNCRLVNIEVTAPRDVLIERYKHRLANIDPAKKDWKFKTLDEFTAKLQEPYYRPPHTITYDTSHSSPDEIVGAIVDLV